MWPHIIAVEERFQWLEPTIQQNIPTLLAHDRLSFLDAQRLKALCRLPRLLLVREVILHIIFYFGTHLGSVLLDHVAGDEREMIKLLLLPRHLILLLIDLLLINHLLIGIIVLLPLRFQGVPLPQQLQLFEALDVVQELLILLLLMLPRQPRILHILPYLVEVRLQNLII